MDNESISINQEVCVKTHLPNGISLVSYRQHPHERGIYHYHVMFSVGRCDPDVSIGEATAFTKILTGNLAAKSIVMSWSSFNHTHIGLRLPVESALIVLGNLVKKVLDPKTAYATKCQENFSETLQPTELEKFWSWFFAHAVKDWPELQRLPSAEQNWARWQDEHAVAGFMHRHIQTSCMMLINPLPEKHDDFINLFATLPLSERFAIKRRTSRSMEFLHCASPHGSNGSTNSWHGLIYYPLPEDRFHFILGDLLVRMAFGLSDSVFRSWLAHKSIPARVHVASAYWPRPTSFIRLIIPKWAVGDCLEKMAEISYDLSVMPTSKLHSRLSQAIYGRRHDTAHDIRVIRDLWLMGQPFKDAERIAERVHNGLKHIPHVYLRDDWRGVIENVPFPTKGVGFFSGLDF